MIVIPGRIPIIIHPFFWLFAFLIGWLNSPSFFGALIWVGIIFVSVLIHEFGHALAALFFRQKVQIQLIPLGGLTSYEGPKLSLWKQFIITFNGPLFGFFLFLLATFVLEMHFFDSLLWIGIFRMVQIANLFWTVVNLLPVLPLDGGQLLRIVLEAVFGVKGFKAALLVGALLSVVLALGFFLVQQLLAGAIFFLFAFQSFSSWRKTRLIIAGDREEENAQLMMELEAAMSQNKIDEAKQLIDQIRSKVSGGIFFLTATQYLAFLLSREGKRKEAYDLLTPIQEHLEDNSRILLQELAFEQNNHQLVADLSADCYQIMPTQQVALRNARSFAWLNQPKPAGGWLQAAWQAGPLNLASLLQEPSFSRLVQDSDFKEFIDKMQ